MMDERGVDVSHTTILCWVQRFVPEFEKRWQRYARPVATSWRVDETYIRVQGRWTYLYRAVDQHGLTVDFLLSEHRDISAARQSFTGAIERHGTPERVQARRLSRYTLGCGRAQEERNAAPADEGLDK